MVQADTTRLAAPTLYVTHCLRFPRMNQRDVELAAKNKLRSEVPRFDVSKVRLHCFDDGVGLRVYAYESKLFDSLDGKYSVFAEHYPKEQGLKERYVEFEGQCFLGRYEDGWLLSVTFVDSVPLNSISYSPWNTAAPSTWLCSKIPITEECFLVQRNSVLLAMLILSSAFFITMFTLVLVKYQELGAENLTLKKNLQVLNREASKQNTTNELGKNKAELPYGEILHSIARIRPIGMEIRNIDISQGNIRIQGKDGNPLDFLLRLQLEIPFVYLKLTESIFNKEIGVYEYVIEGSF